jgi:probable F420-dependent oxidoreductase
MLVDAMTTPLPVHDMAGAAATIRAAGFSGLVLTETGRSAFIAATASALGAPGLHLATGVAVAFSRSPMVTAGVAWELAEATGGNFRLGIGTQVRAHVTRRYGAEFDPPGPRLREYVAALRAIFAAFRGEQRLAFEGDYWSLDLLPRAWSPGPIDVGDPPIDVAAVNPWMLRMAGAVADGVHVHPLNTPAYLEATVVPEVAAGARAAGRDPGDLQLIVPCFTVVGDSEEERQPWRELARMQVGFYGSTPNYGFIFEQLGAAGVGGALRDHQRSGDMAAMAAAVPDELLAHFVVEASWDDMAGALVQRYGAVADRVVLYFANPALADAATLARFGEVARRAEAATGG